MKPKGFEVLPCSADLSWIRRSGFNWSLLLLKNSKKKTNLVKTLQVFAEKVRKQKKLFYGSVAKEEENDCEDDDTNKCNSAAHSKKVQIFSIN